MSDETLDIPHEDLQPAPAPAPAVDPQPAPAVPTFDDGTPLSPTLRAAATAIGVSPPCLEGELSFLLSSWKRITALPGGAALLTSIFGNPFGRIDENMVIPAAVRASGLVEQIKAQRDAFGPIVTWSDTIRLLGQLAAVRAEEACKAQPVRWLGDHGRGSLGVAGHDYLPGDVIDNPEHLAAIGAVRVAQLVATGQAELVPADVEE